MFAHTEHERQQTATVALDLNSLQMPAHRGDDHANAKRAFPTILALSLFLFGTPVVPTVIVTSSADRGAVGCSALLCA